MAEIVYCKDCKYSTCFRKGKTAEKYGKGMACSLGVLLCPDDYDFCSRGEEVLKCPNCGNRYETLPNFCPECGTKLLDSRCVKEQDEREEFKENFGYDPYEFDNSDGDEHLTADDFRWFGMLKMW